MCAKGWKNSDIVVVGLDMQAVRRLWQQQDLDLRQ